MDTEVRTIEHIAFIFLFCDDMQVYLLLWFCGILYILNKKVSVFLIIALLCGNTKILVQE